MRKGQIQLGESTAVAFIIIILMVLGIVVYGVLSNTGKAVSQIELRERAAIEVASSVLYAPELQCSFLGKTSVTCFDAAKLKHFTSTVQEPERLVYYQELFGQANITLVQVYPDQAPPLPIYQHNLSEPASATPVYIPINIYDAVTERFAFGFLAITVYG